MNYHPRDENFAERVRDSFAKQQAMTLIGAALTSVAAGRVEIQLPTRAELSQQHGYVHGGVVVMIADSASGYAAMSLVPADCSVVSVQHATHFLAPAEGELLIASGHVIKSGRTLLVAEADVWAVRDGHRHLCAKLSQTIMSLPGKAEK